MNPLFHFDCPSFDNHSIREFRSMHSYASKSAWFSKISFMSLLLIGNIYKWETKCEYALTSSNGQTFSDDAKWKGGLEN